MYRYSILLAFRVKRIGAPASNLLGYIYPFSNKVLRYSLKIYSSFYKRLYIRGYSSVLPSSKLIA